MMCGRFEQSGTRRYYAEHLGADVSDHQRWEGGDHIASYNIAPGLCPWMITLHHGEPLFLGTRWGYRTPAEVIENKKPWINARIEKALTGRYFRHMFREGRVIVPAGGWYEWTVEEGKKQPWFITPKADQPIFMAGLTNYKPFVKQEAEVGFVIVTQDAVGGMVDVHDRRPIILEATDAMRWMNPETPVEEAAHIAHSRSLPSEVCTWWKVDKAVNKVDPYNNGEHLIAPVI
jgi:putative SOS response-associated peptidase YedK